MGDQGFAVTFEKVDLTQDEMEQFIDTTLTSFEDGDLVKGTVVKIEHDEVLVDIGYKSEGVIPARELTIRKDVNPADLVAVGDDVEALVLQKEDKEGRLILSKKRAEYERAWADVERYFQSSEIVEGEVIEIVKGGLIVDIGLRGFLPASLVDLRRVKDLQSFLGEKIESRVIEMDRHRNNVVLSRRVILEEGRKADRGEILSKLQEGMILPGTISSIVDFGAFVDLGGIDGLVHISELSWGHITHPNEVVKVGDQVEVKVLDVNVKRERISLGLKQTQEDPWKALVSKFPIDSIVDGKVTKLVPFGIFVDLGNSVEGLVHISELARGHVDTPDQVVAVGDEIKVKVMNIDEERRRVSLSMRAAAEDLGFEIEVKKKETAEEVADEIVEEVAEVVEAVEQAEAEVAETAEVAAEITADEAKEADAEEAEAAAEVQAEAEEVAEAIVTEAESATDEK
ncbi:MAG: 30S ribosomal protein S1 [Coriobacteriia bacterium]|nr:30S ribosomal protein S1 [Coriobacteriia bacterium]MCL2870569.1 30S ribosomal protein S1 [Coriobacteriia bacterium]